MSVEPKAKGGNMRAMELHAFTYRPLKRTWERICAKVEQLGYKGPGEFINVAVVEKLDGVRQLSGEVYTSAMHEVQEFEQRKLKAGTVRASSRHQKRPVEQSKSVPRPDSHRGPRRGDGR